MTPEDSEYEDSQPISKSQRKRDVEALQALGAELVKLSSAQVKNLALPDDLRVAVLECQRISSHGALRRQMQYIGKVMRSIEDDGVDAIRDQLAELNGESDAAKARFHDLERWRARLLEDDGAVTEWLQRHPDADAQQLRQLIRNARRESEQGKPPKSSRELFRMLREAG